MNKEHFFSPYPAYPYAKHGKCSCVEEKYDIFTVFSFWFCLPLLIKYYEGKEKEND